MAKAVKFGGHLRRHFVVIGSAVRAQGQVNAKLLPGGLPHFTHKGLVTVSQSGAGTVFSINYPPLG